jgi:hypothetical protein
MRGELNGRSRQDDLSWGVQAVDLRHPKGELAKAGMTLRCNRTSCQRWKPLGKRTGGHIVGLVSTDDRLVDVALQGPGAWEGDLIICRSGNSAAAKLIAGYSRL